VKVMKIRRVGNSNVVSIPRDLETHGFTPGALVVIDRAENGDIVMMLAGDVRERMREIGLAVIADNREALELLEAYDRAGESTAAGA
jgi:antitoxin component of MazEF toxin-antitoxin module